MATGTFTLTITGAITIGDEAYDVSHSMTINSINEIINRKIVVPTSEVTLLDFGAAVGGGQLSNLSVLIIKNEDSTNFIRLALKESGGKEVYIKIPAGGSHILYTRDLDVDAGGGGFTAFSDIDSITAIADTASCDVKILGGQT